MILVIGEAIIDLIESRETKGQFQAVVGGANCNVSLALARRGNQHQFLARISSDRFGILIKERLATNNVSTDYIIDTDEPTTLAVISVNSKGSPTYNFYTNGTADWGWTKQELPTKEQVKALGAKAISFGCLTMAMEPGNHVIEAWAKELQNDLTISHDINIRAALGFDRAIERERVERVNSFSHIIKASDEDIEWLYDLEPETCGEGFASALPPASGPPSLPQSLKLHLPHALLELDQRHQVTPPLFFFIFSIDTQASSRNGRAKPPDRDSRDGAAKRILASPRVPLPVFAGVAKASPLPCHPLPPP